MKLNYFEVRKIGPMYRDQDPQFARADVSIGVRNENSSAITDIAIDVVFSYEPSESIGSIKEKILMEALRSLKSAVEQAEGRTIAQLYDAAQSDQKIVEAMNMAEWSRPAET